MPDRILKFRTPMKCKRGHVSWIYSEIKNGVMHHDGPTECNQCRTTHGWELALIEPITQSQQFTDHQDKSEPPKDIYEGDILEIYHPAFKDTFKATVVWDKDEGRWSLLEQEAPGPALTNWIDQPCRVIVSIHEQEHPCPDTTKP